MSQNFPLSLNAAQHLRQRLRSWYSSLPSILQMRNRSTPTNATGLDSIASLHLAYLTLEILVYRALLRPLGRSNIPCSGHDPLLPQGHMSHMAAMGDPQEPLPAFGRDLDPNIDMQAATEATISAAENCVRLATEFTGKLGSLDFSGFWYSCTSSACISLFSPSFNPSIILKIKYTKHTDNLSPRVPHWLCNDIKLRNAPYHPSADDRACYRGEITRRYLETDAAITEQDL